MPTGARLFCAIALAILAFIVSGQVIPLLPEGTSIGAFTWVNMAVGLLVGWLVMGRRAGNGFSAGITNGLTGMLVMLFWCVFIYGAEAMFGRALDRRYDGPFEAVMAIFELGFEYVQLIFVPNIIITLLIGALVAGLAGEYAEKRFR